MVKDDRDELVPMKNGFSRHTPKPDYFSVSSKTGTG